MLLRRREKTASFAQKCWFLPALLQLIINLIIYSANPIDLLSLVVEIAWTIILGYWLVKELDISTKEERTIESQNAYYYDLMNRGIISKEEYEEKTKQR